MTLHRFFHRLRPGQRLQACTNLCCTYIEDLQVRVGKQTLLEPLSVHLHCGEITALIGPNGAGKSTFLKALIGELPHEGKIGFLNAEGGRVGDFRVGYVPQNPQFTLGSPLTVQDLFQVSLQRKFLLRRSGKSLREQTKQVLQDVECLDLWSRAVGTLSGGELQRVLLALALEPTPNLLLLDEPLSGVDARGRHKLYALVNKVRNSMDLSVILVSHDLMEIASLVDRVILLDRQVQVQGTPLQVFQSAEFARYFGEDMGRSLVQMLQKKKTAGALA